MNDTRAETTFESELLELLTKYKVMMFLYLIREDGSEALRLRSTGASLQDSVAAHIMGDLINDLMEAKKEEINKAVTTACLQAVLKELTEKELTDNSGEAAKP